VNILGSFFPAWLISIVTGLLLALVAWRVLVATGIAPHLTPPGLVYPCLAMLLSEEQILQKMKGLREQIVHTAWARVTHSREEEYLLGGMLDRVIHQNETQLLKFVSSRGIESYLKQSSETDQAFEKANSTEERS
jgi:hypothetical protein